MQVGAHRDAPLQKIMGRTICLNRYEMICVYTVAQRARQPEFEALLSQEKRWDEGSR